MVRAILWKLPLTLAILLSTLPSSARAEGDLDTIRSDVRTSPPSDSSSSAPVTTDRPSTREDHCDSAGREQLDKLEGNAIFAGVMIGAYVVSSPLWLPRVIMQDNSDEAFFSRFPYDNVSGYLKSDAWLSSFSTDKLLSGATAGGSSPNATDADPTKTPSGPLVTISADPTARRWGGQFQADYADEFDALTGIGGQLILESTSRFGFDASAQYLRQHMPGGDYDHLTVGDCNLIYRFAQGPQAQMRVGLGANWLNDSKQTDLGFNFTYGGDFFPQKPWVISSAIDWGTLGRAGLFRFRTTAGVIFNRFESYLGYEYLDIGTTQANFLIGGLRVWF
jgi:hypothetical protein